MDLEQIVFEIISHAGNARSNCYEALRLSKEGNIEQAYKFIDRAKDELIETHKIQTSLLQKEANGDHQNVTLLLMHAEDHLMTAILAKELITEMIELYKTIYETKGDSLNV
ncbi:PTS lactose/cellobiose transporter subunit IIA [Thermoanaerobacterium thermosaccharolyticum]|uniref:PTS lactose/cellobiose transporter subunit IIA n=1 Tax=Thermoanaerobacterium thermosaccharolyticum TaxID=1517 RepID=UPI003D2E16DF